MFKLIATATILVCIHAATAPIKLSEAKKDTSVESQPLHHPAPQHGTHDRLETITNVHKVAPVKENLKEDPKSQAERINNGTIKKIGHEGKKSESLYSAKNSKDMKNENASLEKANDKTKQLVVPNEKQIPVKIVNGAPRNDGKFGYKNAKTHENIKQN